MHHTTRQAALHMIQTAPVFTLATVDANQFPTMVALSPLPSSRSLERMLFYTSRQTTTAQNIQASKRACLFCYDVESYSSVLLKGRLSFVGNDAFEQDWHLELNDFQRQLAYKDPVILQFQTSAIKVRKMMQLDHLELIDEFRPKP
ncbi:pyridoxamine 5'-phosphate oxidase family protein [Lactiplantibacillus plajomi]|uniref:Pyridoxamine 5'-phosphate oxidase family protein n=1 Tax=Lactiplantibacillus plajomi TaxID=1457217 RepID=A0ABV6K537_9LACO|nr:pyridoxamine 5'-phosphate oxidase family protein [Lactiplantibacillus plajomi]